MDGKLVPNLKWLTISFAKEKPSSSWGAALDEFGSKKWNSRLEKRLFSATSIQL